MKKLICCLLLTLLVSRAFCWGFYAHQKINYFAVFLLPPEMMVLYKSNIAFLTEHATDPDKKRYAVASEGAHHYIDIDHYGLYPFERLPRKWSDAVKVFSEDTLRAHGIVPWWIQTMLQRLTEAFKQKNAVQILRFSTDIGHYIADAHVPLHTSSNHNGQLSGQEGIHAFWESRIPELLAESNWDFFVGRATFIKNPSDFIWKRVLESAAAADTVLKNEKRLNDQFASDKKYAFEEKNGKLAKQYSSSYTIAYNTSLRGMVERRMRQSILAVASFWYTAWVNAGQPDLSKLSHITLSAQDIAELAALDREWKNGVIKGRKED